MSTGAVGQIPSPLIGHACQPVRAILFDKSADQNWSLGWHQDRTIAVEQRIAVDGFGPWSAKSGMLHVEPPFKLLSRMVTVRVHLDAVPVTNAP
ncbi:MAG: phytanoyl-CoA dioxygenase family protein, partial [Limisphaerales bacterium]